MPHMDQGPLKRGNAGSGQEDRGAGNVVEVLALDPIMAEVSIKDSNKVEVLAWNLSNKEDKDFVKPYIDLGNNRKTAGKATPTQELRLHIEEPIHIRTCRYLKYLTKGDVQRPTNSQI